MIIRHKEYFKNPNDNRSYKKTIKSTSIYWWVYSVSKGSRL